MTKSKKQSSQIENLVIATILIGSLFFATGVVVANYFAPKSADIYVVHPLSVSEVHPQTESIPAEDTQTPLEEPVLPSETAESEDVAVAPPSFIEQSIIGWKIIATTITAPFTK